MAGVVDYRIASGQGNADFYTYYQIITPLVNPANFVMIFTIHPGAVLRAAEAVNQLS